MFDLAHSLKILSYLCVLTGLFINTYHLFSEAQRSRETLAKSNESLHLEAKRREQAQKELVVAIESLEEQKEGLEQFNALAVGRELQMIELKHEVNELVAANGGGERYDIGPVTQTKS